MKRIKWENIFFILMLVYGVICMMNHNTNELSYIELPIYLGQALLVRYTVKYVRLYPKVFLGEIQDFFKD